MIYVVRMIKQSISSLTISHTIDGAVAAGGDFIGITCTVAFAAGSGPGTVSTPSCDITIINDNIVEQNEVFSLSASILNSNGQDAQFTTGGDSASATIVDDDRRWSSPASLLPRLHDLGRRLTSCRARPNYLQLLSIDKWYHIERK